MLCSLCGHWLIYQTIHGHRYSTDDVCTAFVAIQEIQNSLSLAMDLSHLDLGTGLGSVLLMLAWKFHPSMSSKNNGVVISKSIGIEAQECNANLADRSIAINGCENTCKILNRDIATVIAGSECIAEKFDLVTGTPPYFDLSQGATSMDEVRTRCAFESRGGIELYTSAAAACLKRSRHARFIVCETSLEIRRTEKAAAANGFHISERVDVFGREGRLKPLFSVFVMKWRMEILNSKGEEEREEKSDLKGCEEMTNVKSLYVRRTCGCHTADYDKVMSALGRPLSQCLCGKDEIALAS